MNYNSRLRNYSLNGLLIKNIIPSLIMKRFLIIVKNKNTGRRKAIFDNKLKFENQQQNKRGVGAARIGRKYHSTRYKKVPTIDKRPRIFKRAA